MAGDISGALAMLSHRSRSEFRTDIQGLRAVAVGTVLLYHANAPFLPGGFVGVDVFFVISGFLITGILLREAEKYGRVSLAGFYAKRARRILPAATVALLATVLLTVLFLPPIRWQGVAAETVAAALYVVNWLFAANTDYLNADVAASPLQHFWTLAVEEQFYIVWPLVIVALLFLARRKRWASDGRRTLRLLRGGVLLLAVPSFLWSILYTASDPAPAYFVTTTRLWELAVGALVAVFATRLETLPVVVRAVLGWFSLAGILAASLFYTSTTPFPGVAALLPTLSAAAVVVGGMNGRAGSGAGALLSVRPMRWVGDISYSLYLWHWPLVVVATYLLDGELRFRYGLLVVLLSFLPAWLSYRFVENPFRNWHRVRTRTGASLAAGAVLVTVATLAGAALYAAPAAVRPAEPVASEALGALALASDPAAGTPVDVVEGGFVPSALEARDDNPVVYENGCHAGEGIVEHPGCTFGDEQGAVTVALVGDSHAASWVPALQAVAEERGWRLRVFTKGACSFSDATQSYRGGEPYESCRDWNRRVQDILAEEQPDLVITTNSVNRRIWDGSRQLEFDEGETLYAEGLHRAWERLNDQGIPVVAIRDTPDMGIDVPECVSAHPDALTECAVPRSTALEDRTHPEERAIAGLPSTELIDMNRWICPAESCAPVIGNVLVWRDEQHLTASYAKTLAQPLLEALQETRVAARAF